MRALPFVHITLSAFLHFGHWTSEIVRNYGCFYTILPFWVKNSGFLTETSHFSRRACVQTIVFASGPEFPGYFNDLKRP